jgi:MA3 domain
LRTSINLQGRVHNPTGEGVRAISTQVKAKTVAKLNNNNNNTTGEKPKDDDHETKVKEGTAKRNIIRKKTADKDTGNYNSCHKKQGGHGKGQWRDEMDPSYAVEMQIDENDPLYDVAEDSDMYVLSSSTAPIDGAGKRGYDPSTSKAVYGPLLTLCEFKVQLAESIKEYYDSCDADEVIRSLQELGCIEYHSEIVKKAISLSLDKGPRERELTSRLLTCLHPTPLSLQDMEHGFNILLDGLDDLSKDVPDAKVRADGKTFLVDFLQIFLTKFFLCFVHYCVRLWQHHFWPELLLTKFCHQHTYLTSITNDQVMQLLKRQCHY